MENNKILESVIDKPHDTLDTTIWDIGINPPVLTDVAQKKINTIIEWVTSKYNIPNLSVFIIGSITSNQYTKTSDIDIDFSSDFINDKSEDEIKDFGWKMKSDFMENFPEEQKIEEHPIEIFFQPNPFQCMMSVGCYNVLENKWEVGPKLVDIDYDPMADIYFKSKKQVDKIIEDVRNNVLRPYESALVYKKSNDDIFKNQLTKQIITELNDAGKMYKNIKKARSAFKKDPTSKEDALKKRNDIKWQTKDSAFKLLDKYGYVQILKDYLTLINDPKQKIDNDTISDTIIQSVKNNLDSSKWLTDSEKEYFTVCEQRCNESFSDLVKMSVIAGLLSIPGILPAKEVENAMKSLPKQELKMKGKNFQTALLNIDNVKIGNYSMSNAINIVTWTLFGEGANQSLKGRKAIASVILNRAGGIPIKMIDVALDPDTFSMRRPDDVIYKKYKLTTPTSDLDYAYTIPFDTNVASVAKVWNECKSIATQLILGKFTSTIGNRNSYLNVELTKKKFPNSSSIRKPDGWYYKMTNKLKIEDHIFGYLPENDGYKLNKIPKGDSNATTYTVKKGDSLWKIAFMFDTTAKKLANINGISTKTPLKVGQTLQLKQINTQEPKQQTVAKRSSNTQDLFNKQTTIKTPIIYTVKKGDNLTKISKRFNIPLKQLASTNRIGLNEILPIGKKLKII